MEPGSKLGTSIDDTKESGSMTGMDSTLEGGAPSQSLSVHTAADVAPAGPSGDKVNFYEQIYDRSEDHHY